MSGSTRRNFSVVIHLYNDKRNSPQSGHSGDNAYFFLYKGSVWLF